MWVFTETGFFSVVAYDPSRDGLGVPAPAGAATDELLLARARVKDDLAQMLMALELPGSRAVSSQSADYPWRALITRQEWARFLTLETDRLDYVNFKARVEERSDAGRHDVYMQVWWALRGLRDPGVVRETPSA